MKTLAKSFGTRKRVVVRDPIHGFIDLSYYYPLVRNLVETTYFQRLRRLSQLVVSIFVYPSATHNRFNHSLGAMELFVKLFDNLSENHNDEYHVLRKIGIAAVLLHDIGHGPFSHATENIFGYSHEALSVKIVREEMSEILEEQDISTSEVTSVISRAPDENKKMLTQLLSSQLDVDRLDYLARDIYFTGVGFGGVDLDRIIRTLTIYQSEDFLDGYAVVEEKGKHSVESYLLTRAVMYDDVYYHKTTRCVERILKQIFVRAGELSNRGEIRLPTELNFLTELSKGETEERAIMSSKDVLPLDDHQIYTLLSKWSRDDSDTILSDLSSRIINRKLLKTTGGINDSFKASEIEEKIIQLIRQKTNLDPEIYCMRDEPEDTPYDPIKSPLTEELLEASLRKNIFVKLRDGKCKEISEDSPVIKALTEKKKTARIYFPESIRDEVSELMRKYRNSY